MFVMLALVLLATTANLILLVMLLRRASPRAQDSADSVRNELRLAREEARGASSELRGEIGRQMHLADDAVRRTLTDHAQLQQNHQTAIATQMRELTEASRLASDRQRALLDERIKELKDSNERKLEEMRRTVDEKLHDTLEKRLGESFKLVSERLESVHKGLGEMQTLASGVGDLKRVLTNVKARGTWAEVQLGAILEQILTPEQFARNVCVKEGSAERVEFAVRLPGAKDDPGSCLWLPIDSKFPHEDYGRLQNAAEQGDPAAVQAASDGLLRALRVAARDIHEKYVTPPATTDFAIMFLATEGLYAEALRQPAFIEELQQQYRIVLAGPTTLSAILSSLRMGFQTLAVEKRAVEVWRVLGGVKTEFSKFGTWLDRVQRQLQTATNTLAETGTRTRAMERRLRSVEQLTPGDNATILRLPGVESFDAAEVPVEESAEEPSPGANHSAEDTT